MKGRGTRVVIFALFVLVWVLCRAGNGHAGPLPEGQVRLASDVSTSEVEIYRNVDRDRDNRAQMINLCRRLEDDWNRAEANRNSVEDYRSAKPGVTEYHREIRESNRFADPADEQKTIELCRQLETEPQRDEVRVYRETTVPPEGWRDRDIYREWEYYPDD